MDRGPLTGYPLRLPSLESLLAVVGVFIVGAAFLFFAGRKSVTPWSSSFRQLWERLLVSTKSSSEACR